MNSIFFISREYKIIDIVLSVSDLQNKIARKVFAPSLQDEDRECR